jgi:hypothetical protein
MDTWLRRIYKGIELGEDLLEPIMKKPDVAEFLRHEAKRLVEIRSQPKQLTLPSG